MQRTQLSKFRNALGDDGSRHSSRRVPVPAGFIASAQANPFRPRSLRSRHSVKMDPRPGAGVRHRGDASARRGEAGSGACCEAQEAAARRIAHRLHDESAQMLATVYLALANIARDCPDKTVQKIDLVVRQLDGVREQLRGLSHELSPPILDQFGLMAALQSLANGVTDRSGLKIVVSGSIASVPRSVEIVLYRVVQEALSNVVRHARATEAEVRLSIGNNVVCCHVSDDGIGLKMPDQPGTVVGMANWRRPVLGLGLAGIRERVTALHGCYRIASCHKGGVELQVEIPL